ncbi:tRNA lysidine(34) synthetase TilS [Pseudoalteromonas ruthenica]|uniref:tRNA lysidine(34) synthetase TilS n=1 Tax=Pseudoalteromonas ruthenica TaxID=151081 RepID=UPI00241ED377|nr:tRNA lysidine(34) synthetase TilS [Pseudoalteromonas ruthenica]|tara:strand:+ start:33847 stop:35166 length:1320 start_codon:yes stop_codon:yes gene_type:complete
MQDTFSSELDALLKCAPDTKGLAVALSGGLDSMVLLELAWRYAQRENLALCAIHVHHNLSADADQWLDFCAQQCEQREIAFFRERVHIGTQTRRGIEDKARQERYQALDSCAPAGYVLLLGQHRDDQVETFFLRLKRGAGLKGLGGMQALSYWHQRPLLRPLLGFSRAELNDYAERQGLLHIHDESNDDNGFDRNFLRNQALPLLSARFNGFYKKVAQSMAIIQRQQKLLDEIAHDDIANAHAQSSLNLTSLRKLSDARYHNALRYWLYSHDVVMPSEKQLQDLAQQLSCARADSQMQVVLKRLHGSPCVLRRYQDHAYLCTEQPSLEAQRLSTDCTSVTLSDGTVLSAQAGEGVRPLEGAEQLSVRFGQLSSVIRPHNKAHSKKLSQWFKALQVPPWQRQRVPLIYYDDVLVAVVGYFYNYDYFSKNGVQWQCSERPK